MKTRREFLWTGALVAAAPAFAAGSPFRYSICNEIYGKMDFRESCKLSRAMGYTGLEISPFTLADDARQITKQQRRDYRDAMHGEGLQFVGMHWLLVTPTWLHVTTPDAELRKKSWDYFNEVIDLAGDLNEGQKDPAVMVFGSPKQRGTKNISVEEARDHLAEGLAQVADHAHSRNCVIAIEALDHSQTDVVNTLAESAAMVHKINKPGIQTMFDFHNTPDEKDAPEVLVERYFPIIRHVHINEMDGRHPGSGHSNYVPLLQTLKKKNFRGWISLEVFDTKLGAERIGREAIEYLKGLEAKL